jgi:hypothetical protein
MEIKRYTSICFLKRKMKKDLFNINLDNSSDEFVLLSPQSANHDFSSECKKIDIDKWKKLN